MSDIAKKKQPAVIVKDIHKEFILPQSKNSTFKQTVVNIVKKNNKVTQKTLDGVSFTVNKGDFFGIVGRNGSGKSTLLKLIAGVYTPTQGSVTVDGGLTPFIELGVGFNPELSGRDNVYLNGALLGFDRKQMDAMYADIVEFAELGPFMDQKLKNYSSGMQVRLAFSIAIKAKNDILIFDEVLAVGDEAFQRKCLDVFERYKAEGQTVILVTHDMDTVKKFCTRAVLISEGKLAKEGNPVVVADEYSRLNQQVIDAEIADRSPEEMAFDEIAESINLRTTKEGKRTSSYDVYDTILVDISWKPLPNINRLLLDLYTSTGVQVCNFITSREGLESLEDIGRATLELKLNLAPGSYYFAVGLWEDNFRRKVSGVSEIGRFIIKKNWDKAPHKFAGVTLLESKWKDSSNRTDSH